MENELPQEIQVQIKNEARNLYSGNAMSKWPGRGGNHLMRMYEEGATEWAQWKVLHDELKAEFLDLGGRFNTAQAALTEQVITYQQMKERCDKMAKEHSDLNLALAAMLNGYQNLSMYQKGWFTVPKDLIDAYTKMVLEYDLQGKGVENG